VKIFNLADLRGLTAGERERRKAMASIERRSRSRDLGAGPDIEIKSGMLSWREVDFAGVVLAGIVAGYVMAMAGLWASRVPGLAAIDIADFGRRYMVSDRPSAWLLGLASHLVNSILFALVWAMGIAPAVHWPRLVTALVYGEVLAIVVAGGLIAPMSGLGFLGRRTHSYRFALTSVLLHGIWGLIVGLLYVPR
jgi:hypothetical protein